MATENSSDYVLFSRDQDDNDIWDDTALIKAYDHAVSAIKSKMEDNSKPKEDGEVIETDNDKQSESSKKEKKRNSKRRRKPKDKKKWKSEDICKAVYSVDGQVYDAQIVSVDDECGTCIVSYFGYGNEEEKFLSDLLSPGTSVPKKKSLMSDVDTDSMEWNVGSPMRNRNKHSPRNQQHDRMPWGAPGYAGFSHNSMPPPPPPPIPPMPQFPGFSNHSHSRIPAVPPPPPMLLDDSNDEENDALCSMLMAWYMSGYHTGYYQGLRQGKTQWNGPDR